MVQSRARPRAHRCRELGVCELEGAGSPERESWQQIRAWLRGDPMRGAALLLKINSLTC